MKREEFQDAERRIAEAKQKGLRELDLSELRLSELPETLVDLIDLTDLNLSQNYLSELPDWIGRLTRLDTLNISNNKIGALPDTLEQLLYLRSFDARQNLLGFLPDGLANLSRLKHLNVANNNLSYLPAALKNLEHLDLSHNQFGELPDSLTIMRGLHTLIARGNMLSVIPPWFWEFKELRELNLAENRFTSVPKGFGDLVKLQTLNLAANRIRLLPGDLVQLEELNRLELWGNKLTNLPKDIGELKSLEMLNAGANELTSVPESLGAATELRQLYVNGNKLSNLPESLYELVNLESLDLSGNELKDLSPAIENLAQLKKLNLSGNRLTKLPNSLQRLDCLEALYLHGNQSLGIPEEILGPPRYSEGGQISRTPPSEILDYYFRTHPIQGTSPSQGGGRPLLEARIIVIGDGAAGKTSLVRQLLNNEPAQQDEPSTRDVVIADWNLLLKNSKVQVNVWDFGGQKQMHAAHPYFFTTRTLYLIVAEARKDQQDRVDYWLKMVAKYGDNARALVVINKIDGHAMALDRPKLLDRYRHNLPEDSSAAFFASSCTTGNGITELRRAIHDEIENMPQVWALWPDEWFRVKEAIIKLRETKPKTSETLTFDAWTEICNDCKIQDAKDQENLLENLGHLGRVICFPRDAHLCNLGVLNPEWVTRGIYPLLVETKLAANGGLLTMADLAALLPEKRYPKQRHAWLVQLMKAFELIFEDSEGNLLLPGQLPTDSPPWAQPQNWSDDDTLHLELRYDGVLPESVISQFIVRRCREVRHPGEWWRHGIAIKRANCEALVRAHTTEQEAKIEIRVRGPVGQRRDFLSTIREGLRDPKDTRPPELHVILGKDCAPKYYELLVHAARKRELDFFIGGESVTLPLAPILDMIEPPGQQQLSREAVNLSVNVHNQNSPYMSTENYSNTGANYGIIGKGNTQNITGSFNTQGADIGALMQALDRLQQAAKKLPSAETNALRPQLSVLEAGAKTIEAEAKKEKPNKGLLELTKDGMVTAAKTCAAMAPSLLEAANAVAKWFM